MALLAVVLAAAVAMTTALVVVLTSDGSKPAADDRRGGGASETGDPDEPDPTEDEPERPEFPDWLAPTSPIKVARLPYVSPCQALNYDDVREIFGDLPPAGRIHEENYDSSIAYPPDALSTPIEATCDYDGLVALTTEQYPTVLDLTASGIGSASISGAEPEEIAPQLRRYRSAASLSDDPELTAFVEDLVAAGQANVRYGRDYDRRAFRGFRFRDVVVPVGPDPLELRFFHRNVALTIGPPGDDFTELPSLSDQDLLDQLERLKTAIERVRERVADPQLSQSSAPTLTGDMDKYGDTYLLEPCAVLTKNVFRAITGREANEIVRREVLPPVDIDAPGTSETAASEISILNSCDRKHETERADFSSTEVTIRLAIRYAPSVQALRESMRIEGFLPLGRRDSRLRTPADFAAEYPIQGYDGSTYLFTVDSYLVEVSVDVLLSEGTLTGEIIQGQSDRVTHVRAIKALVPALKQHLAEVEAAG